MKKLYTLAVAVIAAGFSASAIEVADINEMYAIGTAVESGWSMGGPRLEKEDEGLFKGSMVLLNGELKFNYQKENWDAWVFSAAENAELNTLNSPYAVTLNAGGDWKFDCKLRGAYQLTLNLNDNQLVVTDAPRIYIVGDATPGGWNLGEAVALTGDGQTYTGTANLGTGEFKFLASNLDFNSSILAAAPSTAIELGTAMAANLGGDDNKWVCSEAGSYNFTVVVGENPTVTITKNEDAFIPTAFNLVGSAVNAEAICVTDGIFKYCGHIGEGMFRISATDGNTTKWIKLDSEEDDYFSYTDNEDEALTLEPEAEDAGDYQLFINTLTMEVDLDWYEPWENLYIVGSFNGWTFDAFEKTGTNEFTWTGDINLDENNTPEEVKFSGVDNFDDGEEMLHPYVANENFIDARYCYNGGNDNKWLITESANYKVVVNTLMQTVNVTAGPSAVDTVKSGNTAVKAANGMISVKSNNDALVTVYNIAGRVVAQAKGSDLSFNLAKGIYIVKAGETTVKVAL